MTDGERRRPLRVALLAREYVRNGQPWLTADLACALAAEGCEVEVFVYAPDPPPYRVPGVRTHYAALAFGFRGSWILRLPLMIVAHLAMLVRFAPPLLKRRVDLLVTFTPFGLFAPIAPLVRWLRASVVAGVVWDFYPVQRIEMGLTSSGVASRVTYAVEHFEFVRLDRVLLMTPRNGDYLEAYHPGVGARRDVVHLWRAPTEVPAGTATKSSFGLDDERETVAFGGSIVAGRDLESLLDAAALLLERAPHVEILVIGSGKKEDFVADVVRRGLSNVRVLDALDLVDYQRLLRLCSAGIVVTSQSVSSPSFPSKVLDYMWAELPVVASVRPDTDFGAIIESDFGCGVSCAVGEPQALADAIVTCIKDRQSGNRMGRAGHRVLLTRLTPQRVARVLIDGAVDGPG